VPPRVDLTDHGGGLLVRIEPDQVGAPHPHEVSVHPVEEDEQRPGEVRAPIGIDVQYPVLALERRAIQLIGKLERLEPRRASIRGVPYPGDRIPGSVEHSFLCGGHRLQRGDHQRFGDQHGALLPGGCCRARI
jgi:hypothetical protein